MLGPSTSVGGSGHRRQPHPTSVTSTVPTEVGRDVDDPLGDPIPLTSMRTGDRGVGPTSKSPRKGSREDLGSGGNVACHLGDDLG